MMMNLEKEMDVAFRTVGLLIKTGITKYVNEGKKDEAQELENAYNVLNKHFENKLELKYKSYVAKE